MLGIDEIEQWKADVCECLSIPAAFRTEQEQTRLWARRVRLLGNGWRVVLGEKGPVFRYVGNADGWPEYWAEILKERIEDESSSSTSIAIRQ